MKAKLEWNVKIEIEQACDASRSFNWSSMECGHKCGFNSRDRWMEMKTNNPRNTNCSFSQQLTNDEIKWRMQLPLDKLADYQPGRWKIIKNWIWAKLIIHGWCAADAWLDTSASNYLFIKLISFCVRASRIHHVVWCSWWALRDWTSHEKSLKSDSRR